ncbi:helix-turn-helix domain-containing protein [Priestia aryabhattai]|uniref:helix-turn-helix domain-containing protein n=1 Tax=Priestia aryabhattai TaxID=412384 RepID=UPI003D2DFACD
MYQKIAKKYATFETVEQMNHAVRHHLYRKKHLLSPTAIAVLKHLSRFSVQFVGVSFLKVDSIVKAVGKHRTTIIRAINTLCKVGILKKEMQYREVSGGNGANFYIIQPYTHVAKPVNKTAENSNATPQTLQRESAEKPCSTSPATPKTESETIISKDFTKVLKRIRSTTPFNEFKSWVNAYVKDNKLTNKLYGIYKAQTHYIQGAYDSDLLLNIAIEAIKTTFNATKRKQLRNIAGYFNNTLDKLLDRLYYVDTSEYVTVIDM